MTLKTAATFCVAMMLAGCATPPPAPIAPMHSTITGRVVAVADGDTVTLLAPGYVQQSIRLAGIDAPEKGQAFSRVSRDHLAGMVLQQDVQADCGKVDRYGRRVCKVLVGGRDANLEQVRAGLAWHYREYAREQAPADRSLYAAAEESARDRRAGLWVDPAPVAPWDFRRAKRDAAAAAR